ncbi:tropomyosin Pen a 1.0102-like [Cherax quadricarinatus]|uniref:tropomyosin Pen a 1.0102-like n=1 Tax=Cherax quadricarinatus TaxID=27406 RepID=UPI00387E549F
MKESILKLRLEAQKVDKELAMAEAELSRQTKETNESKNRRDQLQEELHFAESRTRTIRNNLRKCHYDVMKAREKFNVDNNLLAELQHDKALVTEDKAKVAAVVKVAQRRMRAWQVIQQTQRDNSPEKQQLILAQQRVASLKVRRDSLIHLPGTLANLRIQIDSLVRLKAELEMEANTRQEVFKELRNEVHRAHQDVKVYQQRKEDYVRRLQSDLEQVCARNARLASELSQIEAEVIKMKDKLEARGRSY